MSASSDKNSKRDHAPAPFIVGVNRSGTTLLRMMLDSHPKLAIPAETHFLPELLAAGTSPPAHHADLIVNSWRWVDFGLSEQTLRRRLEAEDAQDPAAAVRVFYALCAEQEGKPRWGDKTPAYLQSMAAIATALPEARFVHLIRDGRDVALSILGQARKRLDVGELAERWKERILRARRQAPANGRYLEIRFEDLVSYPKRELRRITSLIELPFSAEMLDYSSHARRRLEQMSDLPEHRGRRFRSGAERRAAHQLVTRPPLHSAVGRWRTALPQDELEGFYAVAGELLADLGYEAPGPRRQ